MRRFLFLLSVVILGFSVDDVRKEYIELEWVTADNQLLADSGACRLYFDGASFTGSEASVPVYSRMFDVDNSMTDIKFVIDNLVFKEIEISPRFHLPDNITDEIQIKTYKLQSGDNFKINLQITPLKVSNGKLYLLKRFSLNPVKLKNKSGEIAKAENSQWKSESVLKSGKWVKIAVSSRGIYKIPYSKLKEMGFANPSKVSVYGSGGMLLSENPAVIEYDDLEQNSVWHGKNGGADCLFFYAPGTVKWQVDDNFGKFAHTNNEYTDKGYFFLTDSGTEKIAETVAEISGPATYELSSYDEYQLYEKDIENILPHGSGKLWYGEKYKNGTTKNFDFNLKNVDTSSDVFISVSAVARSAQSSEMKILANQNNLGKLDFNRVNTGSQTAKFADDKTEVLKTKIQTDKLKVTTKYFSNNSGGGIDENAIAWLDYIEVNYRSKLKVEDEPLFFRDINSVGDDNVVEFIIENCSSSTKVFDISDINNIKEIPLNISGSVAKMKRPANKLYEYALVNTDGNLPEPEVIGEVENQNLHALETPELLIIAHSNYINQANNLADFHRSYDNMSVEVVRADKVYNEFSSGSKNATGIRNFIKMFYDRNKGLKYVLLVGDGSYDNRGLKPGTKSFIPTYQSLNSLNPVGSFVTDDYFVILDNDESVYSGAVDLGIGRIPATTAFEAELVVDKIKRYYSEKALGDWRNVICFIGDDQDGGQTMHMEDSEKLANYVNENHPEFITDKIYFDAYVQQTTPAGERYPDVNAAINKRVNDGVLVLNYVGHANERFLADEHVLDVSDINSWSNTNRLPIFVTATCEFSRFDADNPSAGEFVLFNPNGGGIGLFSTTRVVFAYSNFLLSQNFYKFVFSKDEDGNHYRLGDIMRLAKINTINTTNKRNFSLLADPALKLSYPEYRIVTTTINGNDVAGDSDTISALEKITISGYVCDNLGKKLESFNGEIMPSVFDKAVMTSTLGNGGYDPVQFKVQENIIYKGLANVKNGEFTFSFVVPKDISYNLGNGKIIYYAKSGMVDAHGAFENFIIGGSSDDEITDNEGPDIKLYIDSKDFVSGGVTGRSPVLLADISDKNGINTVGNGIGHDITAVIDDDYSNVIVLNNFYKSNLNDFTSGEVKYHLKDLAPGKHKLVLKAWDVANNSNEAEIEFEVTGEFIIESVSNYPNPVKDYTFFTFKHNNSDATLKMLIEIFDITGRKVDYISQRVGSSGNESNPVRWDVCHSNAAMRGGIYIYRVTAQNSDGVIAFKSGKMMIAK